MQQLLALSPWQRMISFKIFQRKNPAPQRVTSGRFEIERDGEVAYLEYSLSGDILELIHTEVPVQLRGHGVAALLAEHALQFARARKLRVDVICPLVRSHIEKHPEYADLLMG